MLTLLLPLPSPAALLNWLVQTTVFLGIGWGIYYLALRRERCFRYTRLFLLLAPWLALGLPVLLEVAAPALAGLLPRWGAEAGGSLLTGGLLPTVRITAVGTGSALPGVYLLAGLPTLYGLVAFALLAQLGLRVAHLWLTTRRWPRERRSGYTLVFTGGRRPAGSFGRWVFWDETALLTPSEAAAILAHEVAHVQQRHTQERLLLEVARALLWACPFGHLYPRALACTHEFLADAAVLAPTTAAAPLADTESYVALLARLALHQLHPDLPLTHPFTQSLILTRIRMLTTQSPIRRWKQWLALPLGVALVLTVACEKAAAPTETNTASRQAAVAPPPPALATNTPAPPPPPPPALFYAEQMPEYPGGQVQLLTDLGKGVRYPAEAVAAKAEGKVFIHLIIPPSGKPEAVEVVKGPHLAAGQEAIGRAMEQAALDAVLNLPGKWKPGKQDGKQVAVEYTIPITFSLR